MVFSARFSWLRKNDGLRLRRYREKRKKTTRRRRSNRKGDGILGPVRESICWKLLR